MSTDPDYSQLDHQADLGITDHQDEAIGGDTE